MGAGRAAGALLSHSTGGFAWQGLMPSYVSTEARRPGEGDKARHLKPLRLYLC